MRTTWRWWQWVLLVAAVVVSLLGTVVSAAVIAFAFSGCREIDPAMARQGRDSLLALWAVVSLPWLLAVALSRARAAVVVGALLCSGVALAYALHGLAPTSWDDGWCF